MKKTSFVLFVIILVLSLCSCGKIIENVQKTTGVKTTLIAQETSNMSTQADPKLTEFSGTWNVGDVICLPSPYVGPYDNKDYAVDGQIKITKANVIIDNKSYYCYSEQWYTSDKFADEVNLGYGTCASLFKINGSLVDNEKRMVLDFRPVNKEQNNGKFHIIMLPNKELVIGFDEFTLNNKFIECGWYKLDKINT